MRTPFLGGFYVARSTNLADQLCINLFPTVVDTKTGKDVGALYSTPGLKLLATIGTGPLRGAEPFQGQLYVVSGSTVYTVTPDFAATALGTLGTSKGPVSIINNGTQLIIFDGVSGYLYPSGGAVTLPFSGPVSASYQDGFGLVNEFGTDNWWQSNLFDLSVWDPLNFSSADSAPDNIVAIHELHDQQFLFKQTNTEIWINAGLNGFAFQRLAGVHIEVGCAAAFSVQKAGESLIWVARDDQGYGTVQMVTGYEPKKISTKPVDTAIQSYGDISDAIAYVYQQGGHTFYVVTFPNGNATWVYDMATGLWHSRAAFANGFFSRHWSNCYASFSNLCVVGDYRNGNLYSFDQAAQTDNGTPKKWVRSWRALPTPVFQPMTFSSLQIDMETGISVDPNADPQVVLRWSDDGGHKWSNERFASAGKTGETARRVMFRRLGSTRFNTGLDRIFEISSTDDFFVGLIGADL